MTFCFSSAPLGNAMRAARHAALLAAVLLLPGCGPGTGGTGSGTGGGENVSPLEYFGALPSNVCFTGPVSALSCPPIGNPGAVGVNDPAVPSPGSGGLLMSDMSGTHDDVAIIAGNTVELKDRCRDLRFEGQWGIVGDKDARYFGRYRLGPNGQSLMASLTVQAAGEDNRSLSAVLHDEYGRLLLGPLLLRRVIVPGYNLSACPG